jgi:hypothetical protein
MNLWVRSWTAAGIAVLALMSIPEIYAVVQPSGVANADVCAPLRRRRATRGPNAPLASTAPTVRPNHGFSQLDCAPSVFETGGWRKRPGPTVNRSRAANSRRRKAAGHRFK